MTRYQRALGVVPSHDAFTEMSFDSLLVADDDEDADERRQGEGLDDPRRLETRRISAELGGFGFSVTRRP